MNAPLPASIFGVRTLQDKTLRLTVDLQEMPPEHMAELFRLQGSLGWFYFHEQPIKEIDTRNLPDIELDRDEKHPSSRLRGAIYVLWEQSKKTMTFEVFYRDTMEKLIDFIKSKLDGKEA